MPARATRAVLVCTVPCVARVPPLPATPQEREEKLGGGAAPPRPRARSLSRARELVGFLPDCVGLIRRLLRDPRVPRRPKVALWLLLPYLASPIDLIPDFIPVLGHLDDAALVAAALAYVVRRSGREVVEELWPGSAAGLRAILRLAAA